MAHSNFSPEEILKNINSDLDTIVAFSGGSDSTALLVGLHKLKNENKLSSKLAALHINHGINSQANSWEKHCKQKAESLGITFFCENITLKTQSKSYELEARKARFEVFKKYSKYYPQICLAHHLDDQVETILFRIFRGSGLRGVMGMKFSRKVGEGRIVRPLLEVPKSALVNYLKSQNIDFITDPSNSDENIDRNFLRNSVLPLIESRWNAASRKIFDFSRLVKEELEILDTLFETSYGNLYRTDSLDKRELISLNSSLRSKIIRHWLEFNQLPTPNLKVLKEVEKTFLDSPSSLKAEVSWRRSDAPEQGVILRINKNEIYFEVV